MRHLLIGLLTIGALLSRAQTPSPVTYVFPEGTNVALNARVLVGLCCDGSTLTEVRGPQGLVPGEYRTGPGWTVFVPANPWPQRTQYTISVTVSGVRVHNSTFTTGTQEETAPFRVTGSTPADGQDGALLTGSIRIRFSHPVNPLTSGTNRARLFSEGNRYSSITWTWRSPLEYQWTPEGPISVGVYELSHEDPGLEDMFGRKLTGSYRSTFTTYPDPPATGPRLMRSLPAQDEAGVPTNSTIYLDFAQPIRREEGVFSLTSPGEAAPVALEIVAPSDARPRYLVLRPRALLRGNQEYTMSVRGLTDVYGRTIDAPEFLRFRTGPLPESRTPAVVFQPPTRAPLADKLEWRFNVPLHPYLLPSLVRIGGSRGANLEIPVRLHPDGMGAEADIPGPGPYGLCSFTDRTLAREIPNTCQLQIVVLTNRDTTAPSVRALSPANETTSPPGATVSILFDEAVRRVTADQLRLTRNDQPVAVDTTQNFDGPLQTWRPRQPLPLGSYRVELTGIRDIAGNSVPPITWSFSVEAAPSEAFRLLSFEPASGALNLPGPPRISGTFNRVPNLISAYNSFSIRVGTRQGAVPGTWRVDGNTLIFEPGLELPPGRFFWDYSGVTDLGGQAVAGPGLSSFAWIGGEHASEGASPRAVSFNPEAGAQLSDGDTVSIDFDEPLDRSTISRETIFAELDGQRQDSITWNYDAQLKRLVMRVPDALRVSSRSVPLNLRFVVTSGVQGFHGAAVAPVTINYIGLAVRPELTGSRNVPLGPELLGDLRDPFRERRVTRASPIVMIFDRAVETALVERHLQVAVGDQLIRGRWEWSPDSRAATFFPASLMPIGPGYVFLPWYPWRQAHGSVFRFRVDEPSAPQPIRLNSSLPLPWFPSDAVFDLRFSQDRAVEYVQRAVLTASNPPREIPLTVETRTPRWFLLRPTQAPTPGSYGVELRLQGATEPWRGSVQITDGRTPVSREAEFGPTAAMGEAPVNVLLWVKARTLVNLASVQASLTSSSGEPRALDIEPGRYILTFRPQALLRGNTSYTMRVSGWEDVAGRPLPPLEWTFRTGPSADVEQARPVSAAPRGPVRPAASPSLTFDRPVAPLLLDPFKNFAGADDYVFTTGEGVVSGTQQVSENGRTASLVPTRPWPAFTTLPLQPSRGMLSWTGAPIESDPAYRFETVAGTVDPPKVLCVSPPADASDVPLNARFRVRFEQEIQPLSIERIRLEAAGQPVAVRRQLSSDGLVVSLSPVEHLRPDTVYTAVAEGVLSLTGQPMEVPERWSVRTGRDWLTSRASVFVRTVRAGTGPSEVVLRATQPIDPVEFQPGQFLLEGPFPLASNAALSTDGLSVVVTPLEPRASVTAIRFPDPLDYSGNPMKTRDFPANPVGNLFGLDPAPPAPIELHSVAPLTGSTASPSSMVAAVYSGLVIAGPAARAQITNRGRSLPARLTITDQAAIVQPRFTLLPGESYGVEVEGLLSTTGDAAPPARWTFTIRPDASIANDANVRFVSSTPANGATSVATTTRIVIEFNQQVLPLPGQSGEVAALSVVGERAVPFSAVWRGATVEIQPLRPLPGGKLIEVRLSLRNVAGFSVAASFMFTTAAARDTDPPRIQSIEPTAGSRLHAGWNWFVLRFNEPVNAPSGSMTLTSGDPLESPYSSDGGQTVAVRSSLRGGLQDFALNLLDTITDLSGNRLRATSIPYSSLTEAESGQPRLASATPVRGSENVPADASVTLVFTQALNEASLMAGLIVTEDGSTRPFTLTSESDGKTWRVTPVSPWSAGAWISVKLADNIHTRDGLLLSRPGDGTVFRIQPASNTTAVTGLYATSDSVDVRLSSPAETWLPGAGLRRNGRIIDLLPERISPTWWRLIASEPLTPGDTFFDGQGVELPLQMHGGPIGRPDGGKAEKQAAGEYLIRFPKPVHPFELETGTALLDEQGKRIPHEALVSSDERSVIVRPLGVTRPVKFRIGDAAFVLE